MNKILLLLVTLSFFTACIPEATVVDQSPTTFTGTTDSSTTTTPTTDTSGTTEEYGKIPYYTFQSIIAHGGNSTQVIWSSERSITPYISDQSIFRTDAVLKFRVIAKPSPGKGVDGLGNACEYYAMNYTKLKLKLGIRAKDSSNYSYIYEFSDLALYQVSSAVSFTPPVTAENFVVDVLGPQWDWYWANGHTQSPEWVPVFDNDCIEFEIQMVTDSTYDF